jgi:hypothetical protein
MKLSRVSRHLLARLVLALATIAVIGRCPQAGEDHRGASQDGTASGTTNTVTRYDQPPIGDYWTPEKMRQAKPFPIPTVDGPPVPQQMTPNPYTGPPGSSSPGLGGLIHR